MYMLQSRWNGLYYHENVEYTCQILDFRILVPFLLMMFHLIQYI